MGIDEALKEMEGLFAEYGLAEARWETPAFTIGLRRATVPLGLDETPMSASPAIEAAAPIAQAGVPVSSPMTGVFYLSSSPSAKPFVVEGEPVSAGEVVGLIEAMKVFNEIVATTSGTVLKIVAQSGEVVSPGEPLLYIG